MEDIVKSQSQKPAGSSQAVQYVLARPTVDSTGAISPQQFSSARRTNFIPKADSERSWLQSVAKQGLGFDRAVACFAAAFHDLQID